MTIFKKYAYALLLRFVGDQKNINFEINHEVSTTDQKISVYNEDKVVLFGEYGVCISNKILITPFALKKTIFNILNKHYSFCHLIYEYVKINLIRKKFFQAHYDKVFYLVARHGRNLENPNYAHWLLENLPMVYMYLKEQEKKNTLLLIRAKSPIWVYDSLELLGVDKKNIIETEDRILCNKLVYCTIPYVHSWSYVKSGFLRNWVSATHKKNCNLKIEDPQSTIFLSRQTSIVRRIKNFTEVAKVLKMHKVHIVDTETVTLQDQISLLSNSKCIIAQPGAAMANMIYMPKNSKVIELTPKKPYETWLWKELAKEMQHEYIVYEPEFFTDVRSDIAINISDFDKSLKRFLQNNT